MLLTFTILQNRVPPAQAVTAVRTVQLNPTLRLLSLAACVACNQNRGAQTASVSQALAALALPAMLRLCLNKVFWTDSLLLNLTRK